MNNKRPLFDIFSKLKRSLRLLKMQSAQNYLAQIKSDQKKSFNKLKIKFSNYYYKIKKHEFKQFTTRLWDNFNLKIEKVFIPYPPFSFIRNPIIMDTMFVNAGGKWLKEELKYLEKRIPEKKLALFLLEDFVGNPFLISNKYITSHNSIHHLYHIIKFLNATNCKLHKFNYIVEWGGGYGNLSKIVKRLLKKPITYVIIDTPIFSCIQWLYLSSIFGEKNIFLIDDPNKDIQSEKINLLPIPFIKEYEINADLFISTWALSESSVFSQDFVINKNWFNAKNLLIAYQDSDEEFLPNADRIARMGTKTGAKIEDIDFLPGNHYLFR